MDITGVVWGTALMLCVVLAFCVIIWYLRSMFRDPSSDEYNIDMEKMARYIQAAKDKENKAWSSALSVMPDNESAYSSRYQAGNSTTMSSSSGGAVVSPPPPPPPQNAPPTLMQQAFFNFWKVPVRSRPITATGANSFIEEYKANLKADGFAHRVRRWNRLELSMGRFCSEYNIARLNSAAFSSGVNKPILDVFLGTAIQLLSKKELSWKDLTQESSYNIIVREIEVQYPTLDLRAYQL